MAIEKAPEHGGRETLTAIGDQAFLYLPAASCPAGGERHRAHSRDAPRPDWIDDLLPSASAKSRRWLDRATQRTALAILTSKRLAAASRDMPPCTGAPTTPFAKITGKAHPRRRLRAGIIFKQNKADSGIPCHDSIRSETALSFPIGRLKNSKI
jgi:hypothetical protein